MAVSAPTTAAYGQAPSPPATESTPDSGSPPAPGIDPTPVRAVILVDESGSLDEAAVEREKEAALLLVVSSLSPDTEVAVVGFGSSNQAGQSAVTVACPLTRAEPAKQQFFVECIDGLHRREPQEGPDTDHVAAMAQALSILGPEQEGRSSLVFLLTDGKLDVANSPQYGQPGVRNIEAQRQLNEQIAGARQAGAQIWPLGFGQADLGALDAFAKGGAQQDCSELPADQPTARLATSLDVVARTLFEAIGNANCAQTTDFDTGDLPSGSQVELDVVIPEISTDGVIVVLKGDPRVRVTYVDPQGNEVGDTAEFDDSRFTPSTTNGAVESLRIQNPRPGTWTVRLAAGPDVPSQVVGAAAMWQGVLQAVVGLDPPSPQPGQQAVISVQLQTRSGAVSDPRTLESIVFGIRMSGSSIEPETIPLSDDGQGADAAADDAEYSGYVTIPPDAEGTLEFIGTIAGPGVVAAKTSFYTVVSSGPQPLTAAMTLDRGEVAPGGSLGGKLVVDNVDGRTRTLSLQLRNLSGGVRAILQPPTVSVSASGRSEYDFTLAFDETSSLGPANGTVVLVDAADPTVVYAWTRIDVDLREPVPWPLRLWWLWAAIATVVLVLLLAAVRLRRGDLKARKVDGVTLQLRRGNEQLGSLRAPDGTTTRFRFVVHDATGLASRLDHAYGVSPAYTVTRDRNRVLRLATPEGADLELSDRHPAALGNGLTVTATDVPGVDPAAGPTRRFSDDPYENAADYRRDGRDERPDPFNPLRGDPADATTLLPGGARASRPTGGDPDETRRFGSRVSSGRRNPSDSWDRDESDGGRPGPDWSLEKTQSPLQPGRPAGHSPGSKRNDDLYE